MRLADFGLAFPALLTAIMLGAVYGLASATAIVAIGLFNIPSSRASRAPSAECGVVARVLCCTRAPAAAARRASRSSTCWPTASVLIVQATVRFAIAILAEAGLSYLGLGAQPPLPSLGPHAQRRPEHDVPDAAAADCGQGCAIVFSVLGLEPARRRPARPARPAPSQNTMSAPLLELRNLRVVLPTARGPATDAARRVLHDGARREARPDRRERLR